MNFILLLVIILLIVIAAFFAWRYFDSRRRLDEQNKLNKSLDLQLSTLNSERDRLATVLDQLTDGVLIADADGKIQFANPAAKRLFESAHPIGRTVTEIVRNHQLVEAWRRSRQTGDLQSESIEVPARRQFLQLVVMPDQHAGGSLLLVQDLTRVRRLETVRRDFISNISHELRTPLASLKALTETLQSGALSDPEAGPRFLSRIATEVEALNQMTQELLDLSRIESGQVELNLAPLAPERLLMSAAERMKLQAERAGLTLQIECAANLPHIRADQARLEQVLVNLIHNAVKFTRPGGEVALLAEAADGGVRFGVKDTGIGIPADDLPRIFERFYRVDKSRSGSGTGLGLSIARHIVEAHRGKIWVESVEGQGSTFFFTIPQG
jgi:two-component system phosphate regulon sensor histidine kinase PhoR